MHSILPTIVSSIFFTYGLYVVCVIGFTRIGSSFFALCITSAFWQGTWAILFQVKDPEIAIFLVKLGYFLIFFLPTTLYHFLVEISGAAAERRYVYISYGIAATLGVLLASSNLLISGYYEYFWGYYPKAGPLHPIHMIQTVVVVNRGLYVTFRRQQSSPPIKRLQLRLCIGAILIYFFAAIDYACNYGAAFYPPGVIFLAVSLGLFTIAIFKHDLLNPMVTAAAVAHEVRTPLASIRMLASGVERFLPTLLEGYHLAVEHHLLKRSIRPLAIDRLESFSSLIANEINHTNTVIDMMLASIKMDRLDTSSFKIHSIEECILGVVNRYPLNSEMRKRVTVSSIEDFQFYGSDTLFTLVLFNLMKNAVHAIKAAGKGEICISSMRTKKFNILHFVDTGMGIDRKHLPYIFDAFFTTKEAGGSGVGLALCQKVITSFGGRIQCDSVVGEYTKFIIEFPVLDGLKVKEAQSMILQLEEKD